MKIKIENLKVVHSAKLPYADDGFYATETEKRSMNIITSKEAKKEQIHSLVKVHPETQKKGLFSVAGSSSKLGAAISCELIEHLEHRHLWARFGL